MSRTIKLLALREAATQALEALEGGADSWQLVGPAIDVLRAALAEPEYPLGRATTDVGVPVYVLKKAEPAQEQPVCDECGKHKRDGWALYCVGCVEPLFTSKTEPVQEPDPSRCPKCGGPADNGHDREVPPNAYHCTKCMAEPVAWRWGYRSVTTGEMDWRGYVEIAAHPNLRSPAIIMEPLYTAPPQRKPLTEGDIRDLLEAEFVGRDGKRSWDDDLQVFRLAERAHGIT